jgi:hypothetical protein
MMTSQRPGVPTVSRYGPSWVTKRVITAPSENARLGGRKTKPWFASRSPASAKMEFPVVKVRYYVLGVGTV